MSGHVAQVFVAEEFWEGVLRRAPFHLKQWRGLATRYERLAVIYRAATVLNAVIVWTRCLSDTP